MNLIVSKMPLYKVNLFHECTLRLNEHLNVIENLGSCTKLECSWIQIHTLPYDD